MAINIKISFAVRPLHSIIFVFTWMFKFGNIPSPLTSGFRKTLLSVLVAVLTISFHSSLLPEKSQNYATNPDRANSGTHLSPDEKIWNAYVKNHRNSGLTDWLKSIAHGDGKSEEFVVPQNAANEFFQAERSLDSYLSSIIGKWSFPAGAVAIYYRGEIIYELNRGFDQRSVHSIASVTKTFTAVAILKLAEQGLLNLDDPVSKYLPQLQISRSPVGGKKVTLKHLLEHSSGLPYHASGTDILIMPVRHIHFPVAHQYRKAGEGFKYSNHNYYILAAVIEKVSGKTYPEFIQENIFDTLDMNDSRISSMASGASGIFSDIHDLSTFVNSLFNETENMKHLLSTGSIEHMIAIPDFEKPNQKDDFLYYGLGIRVQYKNGKPSELYHVGLWNGVFAEIRYYINEKSSLTQIGNPPEYDAEPVDEYRWGVNHFTALYLSKMKIFFNEYIRTVLNKQEPEENTPASVSDRRQIL